MTQEEKIYFNEAEKLNARLFKLINSEESDIPSNTEYEKLKSRYSAEIKSKIAELRIEEKPINPELDKEMSLDEQRELNKFLDNLKL